MSEGFTRTSVNLWRPGKFFTSVDDDGVLRISAALDFYKAIHFQGDGEKCKGDFSVGFIPLDAQEVNGESLPKPLKFAFDAVLAISGKGRKK